MILAITVAYHWLLSGLIIAIWQELFFISKISEYNLNIIASMCLLCPAICLLFYWSKKEVRKSYL